MLLMSSVGYRAKYVKIPTTTTTTYSTYLGKYSLYGRSSLRTCRTNLVLTVPYLQPQND